MPLFPSSAAAQTKKQTLRPLICARGGCVGTGRDLLFSDPSTDLPDVKISESVKYVNEGSSFYYTVELTHAPGMREDQTIDLNNDEPKTMIRVMGK